MSHEIETMAWTGEKPWHGLGVEVAPDLTPVEMMKAADLDWKVSKRPSYTINEPEYRAGMNASNMIAVDGSYHLMRDTDNYHLSVCGDDYVPIQNEKVFEFFKKFTDAGHMTMDTAGSLKNGREIWGLAKIAQDFKLPGGDEVKGYLLINQPHIAGKAMTIKFTPIRVVCNNTLTIALDQGGAAFRMPHIRDFSADVQQAAEEALGLSKARQDEFQEKAEFLSSKQFTGETVMNYVAEVYQPQLLIDKAKAHADEDFIIQDKFSKMAGMAFNAIDLSPGATMKSAKGTWWGALNGITFVEDHHRKGSAEGNALHSAWFGDASKRKAKALDKALEYAKAA